MISFSSSSKARQSSSLALSRLRDVAIAAAIPLKRKGIASQGKVGELLISDVNKINVSHFNFIISDVKEKSRNWKLKDSKNRC